MFRSSGPGAVRRPLLILVTAAVAFGTLAVTAAPVQAAGDKVDKAAVLRFGVPIEENGGVTFDPTTPAQTGNPTGRLWQDLIYDTMIHNTPDGKGAPGLATKWTTPDPSTVELDAPRRREVLRRLAVQRRRGEGRVGPDDRIPAPERHR